jgi:hypothetical protein
MTTRVLLGGEGKTELGEWAKEPSYRENPGAKGVLVALLERIEGADFEIVDGMLWSRIRKYDAGKHASPEERNVLGLALAARRARCGAVVFSRDRDGDKQRQKDLDRGIERAREIFMDLRVVGGVAIETIEGWMLVVHGHDGESISAKRTKAELQRRCGVTDLQQMVDAVVVAPMEGLRPGSLLAWLDAARAAFAPP